MDLQINSEHGPIGLRLVRSRDAKVLQDELMANRAWLSPWEATIPGMMPGGFDMRAGIKRLLAQYRDGGNVPFVMEYEGEVVGQLNIWGISRGSMNSATIGYWVSKRYAGLGITPTAVALATDIAFRQLGLHRMEICIRPENAPSLRIVEKLGFRYEGLRRRFIHIDGAYRDHFAFALTTEDVPRGVLRRWTDWQVPPGVADIPDSDWRRAGLEPPAR